MSYEVRSYFDTRNVYSDTEHSFSDLVHQPSGRLSLSPESPVSGRSWFALASSSPPSCVMARRNGAREH